jgi:hypothetical protein
MIGCLLALATACSSKIGDPTGAQEGAADGPDGGSGSADDPNEEGSPPGPDAQPMPVTLSQSSSQDITPLTSVACIEDDVDGNPVRHRENSYYRVFRLEDIGIDGRVEVDQVSLGIESASDVSGSQLATVRIHQLAGNDFVLDRLTQVGSADVIVANMEAGVLDVPIAATVEAGAKMVVEVYVADSVEGSTTKLFVGANAAGQSGPSYLRAPACDIVDPVDLADIGYPDVHIVLSASGTQY